MERIRAMTPFNETSPEVRPLKKIAVLLITLALSICAAAQTPVIGLNGTALVRGFCPGTAGSSTTVAFWQFGQVTSANCSTAVSNAGAFIAPRAGTFGNLTVSCLTGGVTQASFTGSIAGTTLTVSSVTGAVAIGQLVNGTGIASQTIITAGSGSTWTVSVSQTVASEAMTSSASGLITLYDNGSATAITCTLGTATTCSDASHTVSATLKHLYGLRMTTQATETLANCTASMTF